MPSDDDVLLCLQLDVPIKINQGNGISLGIHSPYSEKLADLGENLYSMLVSYATFDKKNIFRVFENVDETVKNIAEQLKDVDDYVSLIAMGDATIPHIIKGLELFSRQSCEYNEETRSFIFENGGYVDISNYKEVAKYVRIASYHQLDDFEDEEEYIQKEMAVCNLVGETRKKFEEFLRRQQRELKREKEERAKNSSKDSLDLSAIISVLSCYKQKLQHEFAKCTIYQIRDQYNIHLRRENKNDFLMQLASGLYDMEKALPQVPEWKTNS